MGQCAEFASSVPPEYRDLLFDPQTSGGLLIAISADSTAEALRAFERHGVAVRRVGEVKLKSSPLLAVR